MLKPLSNGFTEFLPHRVDRGNAAARAAAATAAVQRERQLMTRGRHESVRGRPVGGGGHRMSTVVRGARAAL